MEPTAPVAVNCAVLAPLVDTPPDPALEVSVIVPVKDEAGNLERHLHALAVQTDAAGRPLDPRRYEVILLANNCQDASAQVAREFGRLHPALALHVAEITLPPAQAHVGRARQLLMDEAGRRLQGLGRPGTLIASTDADTQVGPTWIAALLAEIGRGADAVGGRVLTDRAGRAALDRGTRMYYLRDVTYKRLLTAYEHCFDPDPADEWPRHHQHQAANMAVTAEMYWRVGGLPPVRSSEDVALYRALRRVDARFRHSPAAWVVTSTRQIGRAQDGMADKLGEWAQMCRQDVPELVEGAAAIENRARARANLRRLWQTARLGLTPPRQEIEDLAGRLGLSVSFLERQLAAPSFGLLLEAVEDNSTLHLPRPPLVEIAGAISDLRQGLRDFWPRVEQGVIA